MGNSLHTCKRKKYGKNPAQKPEALLERLVLIGSQPNKIILDCFAGTGTTGVVAERLNRSWIMIEKDSNYVDIAERRLAAEIKSSNSEIYVEKKGQDSAIITQPNLLEKKAEYIKE